MGNKSGIKFKVKNNIPATIKQLAQKQNKTLRLIGEEVIKRQKLLSPTDTSQLKQSNEFHVEGNKVTVGNTVKHAIYVELGTGKHAEGGKGRATPWWYFDERKDKFIRTSGQKPQPFVKPATENNLVSIINVAKKVYRELNE